MPYVALYRQWRPQTFAEVVGQSHVTGTLQNALKAGKIGHAYLFAGPRGTGKTSIAKILARAVNCLEGPSAEPCNRCSACVGILDGSATDVLEIDAASNRGIDEIRDLRSKVRFCPAGLKYKVYIIDEVHMLTTEAFNALLKTLEEPPGHAIFILATTEPHKIPATVLSRCQRFSFHRIPVKEVLERMEAMTGSIGLSVTQEALRAIARASDGSLRDALSLLDQCASFSEGEVNASHVRMILGNAGPEGVREISAAVARGDARALLEGLDGLAGEGRDFRQFGRDLTAFYRDMLVMKVCDNPGDLIDQDPESLAVVKDLASAYSDADILNAIKVLGEVDSQMRYTGQPRICLEIGLLSLIGRSNPAERTMKQTAQQTTQQTTEQTIERDRFAEKRESGVSEMAGAADVDVKTALPEEGAGAAVVDDARIPGMWQSLVARLKRERKATIAAYLEPARPVGFRSGRLVIAFGPDARFHMSQIETPHNTRTLEAALEAVTGREVLVRCVYQEPGAEACGEKSDTAVSEEAEPQAIPHGAPEGDDGVSLPSASMDDEGESVGGGDGDLVQKTLDLFDGTIV